MLFNNLYKCSFLILSIQMLEVNGGFSNLFPKVKLLFDNSKVAVSKIFGKLSKFNVPVPSLDLFYSHYSKNLKSFMSTFDELVSSVYDDANILISSSSNFISHFKMNKSLWNWIVKLPDFSCSRFNETAFDFQIRNELFGQHIVDWSLSKLLKQYLNTKKHKKALVMSFHGQTGCGKTYVTKMIVDSLFQEGLNSKFVHIYHGSLHFPHEKNKEKYREKLQHDIFLYSHLCDTSVFIFDEVDKMVPGVIDVLIPYIYLHENNSVNSTKNIFLFLSKSGSEKIEEIMYDAWFEGISREERCLEDFSYYLKEVAYNEPGGLQHSEIVERNFIDMFVPFLPLEKEHIKQCIIKELKLHKKSINKDNVEKIADQLEYYPAEFELYSVSGCKKVAYKVDLYSDDASL